MNEKINTIQHQALPYFDMEAFMEQSRETRLGGAVAERLAGLWERWLPLLRVCETRAGTNSWLAVWLPESVEKQVDEVWKASASEGWLVNTLAQFMCMSALREALPEVERAGCAPSPRPTRTLREALARLEVPYKVNAPTLERRYAVVTFYPWRGGCEICSLQADCPKGRGGGENLSIVLPGHEKES